MSKSTTTNNTKSAAVQKAAQAAQQAQARLQQSQVKKPATNALLENPMYFANLDPASVVVKVDKKNKGKFIVEFNIGAAGRSSGNAQKNTTKPRLCVQLVSASSRCAGEGNLGAKHSNGEFTRGDAKFNISFRVGSTAGEFGGEELLEEQRKCHKWVFDVACAILGRVYDLKQDDWMSAINSARADARRDLWRDIKNEQGKPLGSDMELQELIETDSAIGKAAAKRVEAAGREAFIRAAVKNGNMPCAPLYDEVRKSVQTGRADLHTHGKVYGYGTWSDNHAHRNAKGPLLTDTPSTIEKWGEIQSQMALIDRHYQYAYRLFQNGQEKHRDLVEIQVEAIDETTGRRVKTKQRIQDPFWNLLLQTKGGQKVDTLVLPQIFFGVKRGTNDAGYGVKVGYERIIHMVAQQERPMDMPEFVPDYATGFVEDAPTTEPAAALEEGEVPVVAEEVPAAEGDGDNQDEAPVADEEAPVAEEEDGPAEEEEQQPVDEDATVEATPADDEEEEAAAEDAPVEEEQEQDDEAENDRLAAEQEAARLVAEEEARVAAAAAAKAKAATTTKRKTVPAGAAVAAEEKRARK